MNFYFLNNIIMSLWTNIKEKAINAWKIIWWGLLETWKSIADVWQSIPKWIVKWGLSTIDAIWDAWAFVTDITWITKNAWDKEWFLDKSMKKAKGYIDKQDNVDSALDHSNIWKWLKDSIEFVSSLGIPWWIVAKWWQAIWAWNKIKNIYDKYKWAQEVVKKITNTISPGKEWFLKKLSEMVLRNPKKSLWIWAWAIITWALFSPEEKEQLQQEVAKEETINKTQWTSNWIQSSRPDVNPTYANKESTELLDWTKKDINEITSNIRSQLESKEITKEEAKKQLTTVKEFANFNFDRSISDNLRMKWLDGNIKVRWVLAEKLWIEWYQWTYNQNIQMLNSIRYMDHKEIQELLSK